MKADWWEKIENAYHRARDLDGEERSHFLDDVCGSNAAMRRQIEVLLQEDANPNSVLNRPAVELAAEWPSLAEGLPMRSRSRIGAYEVLEPIGSGGMGDVYRARDTQLHREVALKFLPVHLATDPDRLSRLRREAQMLAALNHPNIAQIYGLEESGSTYCIAMELVDGETLVERIRGRPMPVGEALQIARDIAGALETAHEKGIIHRDLKPANVMVTPEGQVKVLDFGLAKTLESSAGRDGSSPTVPSGTLDGVILGTATYMSPEQVRGHPADRRSDIWAFGCVLFEMLSGRQAFGGETVADILGAVLKVEPDWEAVPRHTPPGIRRLLGRCLQKDRKQRLRDIGDARIEIEEAASQPEAVARGRSWPRVVWIAAVGMAIAAGFAGGRYFRSTPAETAEMRLEVVTPPYPLAETANTLALSPDGTKLVFVSISDGQTRLWLRPLDSETAQVLAGTEGASDPFWSPNSQLIGFFSDGKLKRVDLVGGLPQTLADVEAGTGGSWNDEDMIIYADQGFLGFGRPLHRVFANRSGKPVPIPTPEVRVGVAVRHPQFLPDGRRFLFEGVSWVFVASLDSPGVRPVLKGISFGSGVAFVPPDTLLFIKEPERTLFAQHFDTEKLELVGEPVPVAQQVLTVAASATGVVAYRTAQTERGGEQQWTWVDRSGKPVGEAQQLGAAPELSPDGQWLTFQRTSDGVDVWLMEMARGVPMQFISHGAGQMNAQPIWSPDSRDIVFASDRHKEILNLYRKRADTTTTEEVLYESPESKVPLDWSRSPAGEFILFRTSGNPETGNDLFAVSTAGDHKTVTVANTRHTESEARFSPSGRWVAYQSDETGRSEIYVQAFPSAGRKAPISKTGGVRPRWRRDGKELFYVTLDGTVMAVPVTFSANGQDINVGSATALFTIPSLSPGSVADERLREYVVSRDGQRFLVRVPRELTPPEPIRVILHWKPPGK